MIGWLYEEYRLFANQHKFDSARYYYREAVKRGLKENTKFTLFEVSRLVQEGKQQEALVLFNKNKSKVKAVDKAVIFALFNKFDDMMENLETSYIQRDDDLLSIRTIKEFNRFRTYPEFIKFISKFNFPASK